MVICIDFVHDECNEYVEISSCKGNYEVQTLTFTVYLFNIIFIFPEKCRDNFCVMHIYIAFYELYRRVLMYKFTSVTFSKTFIISFTDNDVRQFPNCVYTEM